MKINGERIEGANVEIIVIPRGDGRKDIVFKARAVMDVTSFEKMCPVPEPPKRKIKGVDVPQLNDKNYLNAVKRFAEKRLAWMTVASLEATDGLEWEKVKKDDPSTWLEIHNELRDSGFSSVEVDRITVGVINANALSESKIKEARDRFLLSEQAQVAELSFQKDELNSMPSGVPAND